MGKYIDFTYVKEHSDFSAVLAHCGIKPQGSGAELRCRCPFHDDDHPSMSINVDKKVFACHADSCGEKGNILEFVRAMLERSGASRTSLRDAAEALADICRIDLAPPKERKQRRQSNERRKFKPARQEKPVVEPSNDDDAELSAAIKNAMETGEPVFDDKAEASDEPAAALKPLGFKLKLDPEHEYGQERGLSRATIDTFEMGYCSRGLMAGRWCVPLHGECGQLVGYCGRFVGDDRPDGEPKYKLPPDFPKGSVLFNLHRALKLQHNQLVIVEGVFDAIRLHELGIPAVALLGSSISDAQVALVKDAALVATVMLDGGTDKARMVLVDRLAQAMLVQSVVLPEGVDPASADESLFLSRMPLVA